MIEVLERGNINMVLTKDMIRTGRSYVMRGSFRGLGLR
jgi:hypothetical protein